jgi:hypothetical protein
VKHRSAKSKEGELIMSDKERKLLKVLSILILIGMLICAIFGWHRTPRSSAWHYAFYALLLINSFLVYRRTKNLPQPDTLTRLFPKATQPSPEKNINQ